MLITSSGKVREIPALPPPRVYLLSLPPQFSSLRQGLEAAVMREVSRDKGLRHSADISFMAATQNPNVVLAISSCSVVFMQDAIAAGVPQFCIPLTPEQVFVANRLLEWGRRPLCSCRDCAGARGSDGISASVVVSKVMWLVRVAGVLTLILTAVVVYAVISWLALPRCPNPFQWLAE